MLQAGPISTVGSDHPPTISSVYSHDRSLTPISSLGLSRHHSTCEKADKSMQTDFFPSSSSMRYFNSMESEFCLRHPSPGNRLTPQTSVGLSEDRFVEMIRPSVQLGDTDSLHGGVATEESAVVQIPELLDYAESNLDSDLHRAHASHPLPLRPSGLVISHVPTSSSSPAVPLIMRNKLFLGAISKQLKVTRQVGDLQHYAGAQAAVVDCTQTHPDAEEQQ